MEKQCKNCRAYNSFISLAFDLRIMSAEILLCLRANKKKVCNNKPYDWTKLKQDINIRNKFVTDVKEIFKTLQEFKPTDVSANTRYNYFEIGCKKAAENIIPLKPKLIKSLPWETLIICQKRELLHQAAEIKNIDPLPRNIKNFVDAQNILISMYQREQ